MKTSLYPLTNRAEKGGYEVVVAWKGVFQEFKYGIAQAGDCMGEVTLRVGEYRWSMGEKSLIETIFGGGTHCNLEHYKEVRRELVNKAAHDNVGLDSNLLNEVLIQALLPYSRSARATQGE